MVCNALAMDVSANDRFMQRTLPIERAAVQSVHLDVFFDKDSR